MTNKQFDDIKVVPQPSENQLNQRQLLDYRNHREKLIHWLLKIGKSPEKAEGYATSTVKYRTYRIDAFYRWVWEEEGRYTTDIKHGHADRFMEELAYGDKSNTHKSNCLVLALALIPSDGEGVQPRVRSRQLCVGERI